MELTLEELFDLAETVSGGVLKKDNYFSVKAGPHNTIDALGLPFGVQKISDGGWYAHFKEALIAVLKAVKPKGNLPDVRNILKRDLYDNRAKGKCETCGKPVKWSDGGRWDKFTCAHLSHIKSRGSGGSDTKENCKIECFLCHSKWHGPINSLTS